MLMQLLKNGFCLLVTVFFVASSLLVSEQAPISNVQSGYDVEYQYIMELQAHRETCYERILFLGTISDRELTVVKRELEAYLHELYNIRQQIEQIGVPNALFQQMLVLDEQLITNTLQAIELQDERYLENLGERYNQLQDYHVKLRMEYVSQKD